MPVSDSRHKTGGSRNPLLSGAARLYDVLQRVWEDARTERVIGISLVIVFVIALVVIELGRRGWVPAGFASLIPSSHFAAIGLAFTLLLGFETLSLVFALARSVANSVGKQFELLSLILLRKSFVAFAGFGEPVRWEHMSGVWPVMLSDMGGALLVFIATGVFYRVQRHRPITEGEREQVSYVAAKKAVALGLLLAFVLLGAASLGRQAGSANVPEFFETFYTVLVFSDVLLVLVALCYSSRYPVVFRNSAFAGATLLARLALTAPRFVNAGLGVGAAALGVAISLAYNFYTPGPLEPAASGEVQRED
ncbi:MAG: hypothetical protein ACRENS_02815 [Candidatus Eiseniibacteriota bacterium]